jgi:hypothetical protein
MNTQLVESLAQIIKTLTREEKILLNELYSSPDSEGINFHEKATSAEWIGELKQWAKTRSQNTVNLSDEAISRESIYGERG